MAPASTADKVPTRQTFDTMVRIKVGEGDKERTFEIHKGVLIMYSGYFERSLQGPFMEAKTGEVTLATEDPEVFDIIHWRTLCKVWIFGDAHDVPLLQNHTIGTLMQKIIDEWEMPSIELHFVYSNTTEGAPLRRFLIDIIAKTGHAKMHLTPAYVPRYSLEAMTDVLRIVWATDAVYLGQADMRKIDVCQHYHVHEKGVIAMFDTMVSIKVGVGHKQRCFQLHKGIVCFYSGYFERAFNGAFAEAKAGAVTLDTEDPDVFEHFQFWLYNRRFISDATANEPNQLRWATLCKLWIFGDAHDVPLLQNSAVDAIIRKIEQYWTVPSRQLPFVYANTTKGTPLRRLLIDILGKTSSAKVALQDEDHLDRYTKESMTDLLRVVWHAEPTRWGHGDLRNLNKCFYHVHEDGVWCPDTK
ncbi:hypothetical protein LTR85_005086 [Meristemomyces frigidus]|nr:hypothetical protein LTR85_005086 [Meristemomyces frigidus]